MRIRVICAAAACAVFVAACGGGSHPAVHKPSSKYGPSSSPYAMSKCMRANGLTNFPDPSQGSGGIGFPGGVIASVNGELTVDGVTFSGPALRKASRACKIYLPPSGPPPKISAQQQRQMLAMARCMRAHGVPNFPDPGSGPPAGSAKQVPLPGSNTPAFNHAVRVCAKSGGNFVRVPG